MTRTGVETRRQGRSEEGAALVVVLLAVILLSALGLLLVLTTSTEIIIAGHYRGALEALYAADAGAERALEELQRMPGWTPVLAGTISSGFVDGPPAGPRTLPDGSVMDLTAATNVRKCGRVRGCTASEMDAITEARPWGPNNPRWQLYAYGPVARLLPASTIDSLMYVVVWVGDDPSENDNNPLVDGAAPSNPGAGLLTVRAEAFGPGGAHKTVEATLERFDPGAADTAIQAEEVAAPALDATTGVRILSWRESR